LRESEGALKNCMLAHCPEGPCLSRHRHQEDQDKRHDIPIIGATIRGTAAGAISSRLITGRGAAIAGESRLV
jgi:hypothetical protein